MHKAQKNLASLRERQSMTKHEVISVTAWDCRKLPPTMWSHPVCWNQSHKITMVLKLTIMEGSWILRLYCMCLRHCKRNCKYGWLGQGCDVWRHSGVQLSHQGFIETFKNITIKMTFQLSVAPRGKGKKLRCHTTTTIFVCLHHENCLKYSFYMFILEF